VLPSPIQQLAHVAVAAPAPASIGTGQATTLGSAHPARHTVHPATSQPVSQPPPHSSPVTRAAATPAGQTPTPRTRYNPQPRASLTPRPPGPGCSPDPFHTPGSFGKPSGQSASPPSWSQAQQHCTSVPTEKPGQPTLYPYLP
jgi:hypothetical protein